MAAEAVEKFLEDQNRPFSIAEITSNAKGDFGKSAVVKALDKLVSKGTVTEKVYNKQKVYFITQSSDASSSELKEELLAMDRQINDLSLQLKDITGKIKMNSASMNEIQGKMSQEEAIEQKLQLEKKLDDIKKELEKFSDTDVVCSQEKEKISKQYQKYLTEYKKRKRICMDMINSILENYPKSKKHLLEDIGIITDEDAEFSLKQI